MVKKKGIYKLSFESKKDRDAMRAVMIEFMSSAIVALMPEKVDEILKQHSETYFAAGDTITVFLPIEISANNLIALYEMSRKKNENPRTDPGKVG